MRGEAVEALVDTVALLAEDIEMVVVVDGLHIAPFAAETYPVDRPGRIFLRGPGDGDAQRQKEYEERFSHQNLYIMLICGSIAWKIPFL